MGRFNARSHNQVSEQSENVSSICCVYKCAVDEKPYDCVARMWRRENDIQCFGNRNH